MISSAGRIGSITSWRKISAAVGGNTPISTMSRAVRGSSA